MSSSRSKYGTFRKWIITSIGQSKHMRVTRFNPLWVSGTTQTYSEEYYGQWTCSPAFQVTVYLSSFSIYPFVTTVVVSKGTESNKFFGFPALSLCNLNAFNTRRFRDLYNGSSNGPFIERYIKDISLMATKSEEILTKEFKSRNIGLFYRFQTADQTLGVKGIMSHQVAEMLLPSKSRSSIHSL